MGKRIFPLYLKLTLLFTGIIIASGIVFVLLTFVNFREVFKSQLLQKGAQLSDFFNKHSSITYGFLQEDKFLIAEVINLFMRDQDVVFASAVKQNGDVLNFKSKNEKIVEDVLYFVSSFIRKASDLSAFEKPIEKKTVDGGELIIFISPVKMEKRELPIIGGDGSAEKLVRGYTVLGFSLDNFLRESYSRLMKVVLATSITMLILLGVGGAVVYSNFTPLKKIKEISEKITTTGDLREKPTASTSDEVGEIAISFALMIDTLRDVLGASKTISRRLSETSKDIFKTMEIIKNNAAKQSDEIRSIDKIFDEVYKREFEILFELGDILENVKSLAGGIQKVQSDSKDLKDRLDRIAGKVESLISKSAELKQIIESVRWELNMREDVSSAQDKLQGVKSGVQTFSENLESVDILLGATEEGVQSISSETDQIVKEATMCRKSRDEVLQKISRINDETRSIFEMMIDLLDSVDDINMLAVNAAIIASREAGEVGREFGMIAEQSKKLSSEAENKIKNLREKFKTIKEGIFFISKIVEKEMGDSINNIFNSSDNIISRLSKIRSNAEVSRSKISYLKDTLKRIDSNISEITNDIYKFGEKALRFDNLMNSIVEPIVYINSDGQDIRNIFSDINNKTSTYVQDISSMGNISSKVEESLSKLRGEAADQSEKITNVMDRIKDLHKMIYEITKVVLISQAKVESMSHLGVKLDELFVKFKV